MTIYPQWDSILLDILTQPNDIVIIQTKKRHGQGGWRGHNAPTSTAQSSSISDDDNAKHQSKNKKKKKSNKTKKDSHQQQEKKNPYLPPQVVSSE